MLRAAFPKGHPPFPVHDVNPHRQVFHHMPEQLRVIKKVRRHDLAAPPSSLIGSQGGELEGGEGRQGTGRSGMCLSLPVCRVALILDIGTRGAYLQAVQLAQPYAAGRTRDPNERASSCTSKIGGWHANPEHTTANDRPSNDRPSPSAGRFGIVSAKAGGRFCATALSASRRRTAILKPRGRTAARYSCAATSSLPTTTTCVCGWTKCITASP